jgi:uncharacterized protein
MIINSVTNMNHLTLITEYISMGSAWLLLIVIAVVSFIVRWRFKSKFKQYSETPLFSGLSGQEVAERMLRDHGIYDVQVISVEEIGRPNSLKGEFK